MDRDIALPLLLSAFPGDAEVLKFCINRLTHEEFPFPTFDMRPWALLRESFPEDNELSKIATDWVLNQDFVSDEVADAAVFSRSDAAKAQLIKFLHEPHSFWAASALLDGWGLEDKETSAQLVSAVCDDDRASAIAALLPRILDHDACHARLKQLLIRPNLRHPDFIMQGFRAMGGVDFDTPMIDAVLALEPKNYLWDVQSALSQLILVCPHDPRVREFAIRDLARSNDSIVSTAVSYAADAELCELILKSAAPLPADLRFLAVQQIIRTPRDRRRCIELLRSFDLEADSETKSLSAIGYCKEMMESGGEHDVTVVASLTEVAKCQGLDRNERRQAGFCGLAELGRLDVLPGIRETSKNKLAYQFGLHDHHSYQFNRPLIRQILQHWSDFKRFGGLDFVETSLPGMWNALSVSVDEFPEPTADCIAFVEANLGSPCSAEILRFLSRAKPRSILLRNCLFTTLRSHNDFGARIVAAELVGDHFAGDDATYRELEAEISNNPFADGLILAVAEGWPASALIDRLLTEWELRSRQLGLAAAAQLLCLRYETDDVAQFVFAELTHHLVNRRANQFLRPLFRRLQMDDNGLAEVLKNRLQEQPTPTELASLPRIVASALGVSSDLRSWCLSEFERQCGTGELPIFGNDVISEDFRPVRDALFDVLTSGK